ncbi:MAG: FMN-dependent NADH-azoreductase [Acidobacteriaceae bacterium]
MKLLRIDSSARSSSVTRQLTAKFVEAWKQNHSAGDVTQRDLATTVLPQITDHWAGAHLEPSQLSPAQRNYLVTSDHLIEELQAADTIVIGAPMYNFAIPSSLKAWIDQIVRMGKTIGYGASGARGLLANKRVIIITARGGAYGKGSPAEKFDFQEPYLRHIFGFIGLTDVTFIHAENQAREEAGPRLAAAAEEIGRLAVEQSQQVAY